MCGRGQDVGIGRSLRGWIHDDVGIGRDQPWLPRPTSFRLELTYLKDRTEAYDLGEQEFHLALRTPNIKEAHDLHTKMGCVCFENAPMGIYFVEDPDGYWIEVIPDRTKPQSWPEEA